MELFTGVDMVYIPRIQKSLENPRFLERVFGAEEIALYEKRKQVSFLAGNFAAKEAFSKAIGTGVRGFALKDVQVLRDSKGKPYYSFSGTAKEIVIDSRLSFALSISHEKRYAIAFVTAWK